MITPEELKVLVVATGKSNNALEKELGVGQGVLGKALKGDRKFPEAKEEQLMSIVARSKETRMSAIEELHDKLGMSAEDSLLPLPTGPTRETFPAEEISQLKSQPSDEDLADKEQDAYDELKRPVHNSLFNLLP